MNIFEDKRTALVIGATGLVGTNVVNELLLSDKYEYVTVLTRSTFALRHVKLKIVTYDFERSNTELIVADDVYCCLGTTMKKAGSKEMFYKVDYRYPIDIANAAKENGAKRFSIITAMGANKSSLFYYNRVKGEVEEALKALKFDSLFIFRPSLLLGQRPETRFGEQIGEKMSLFFKPIIPAKYKAISAIKVAKAMVAITSSQIRGAVVYESDLLQEF